MSDSRSSEKNLKGKVVLISGGTSGIGRATAILLAANGAEVFIFGRHEKKLIEALKDIKRISGKNAHGMVADVSHPDDLYNVFAALEEMYGRLDILINNAALPGRSITDYSAEAIQYQILVDIAGYLICAKLALEKMVPHKNGHIVNIGSLSGRIGDMGADLYVTAKAGIIGFSQSLRQTVNLDGIKISLIEPGSVGTNMIKENSIQQRLKEKEEKMLMAEDIAQAIFFVLTQPNRVEISNIQIKPHRQII